MAYEQFTNDSDYQFTDQLDRVKLGGGGFGGSDYAVAAGAWNTLPEDMALNRVLEMRSNLHESSMRSRALMFADRTRAQQSDELLAFSKEAQGLEPGDYENNAKFYAKQVQMHPDNPDIVNAAKVLGENDSRVDQARQTAFKSRQDQDVEKFYEDTREAREKMEHLQSKALLNDWTLRHDRSERALINNQTLDEREMSKMAGSFYSFDPELADNVVAFGVHSEGMDKEDVWKVQEMVNLYSDSRTLESIDGIKLPRANAILGEIGVNPDEFDRIGSLPPEEQKTATAAYMAKAAEAINRITDPRKRQTAQEALAFRSEYAGAINMRSSLSKGINELLANPPPANDPEATKQWRIKIRQQSAKAARMKGIIDNKLQERKAVWDNQDRAYEMEKRAIGLRDSMQKIDASKQRSYFLREALKLRKQGAKETTLFKQLQLVKDSPMFEDVETVDDLKVLMDEAEGKLGETGGIDVFGDDEE